MSLLYFSLRIFHYVSAGNTLGCALSSPLEREADVQVGRVPSVVKSHRIQ